MNVTTHQLSTPGASIYYEVRGSGPPIALAGAPMGHAGFTALAETLATDHLVVTYDPRGSAGSTVTDRTAATPPELLADDLRRVLTTVADGPWAVFGSSGGAITGLALVSAHPALVSTLIAHEPPLILLLDNAVDELAVITDIHRTYLRAGGEAAMRQFLLSIGVLGEEGSRQFAAAPEPVTVPAPAVPADDNDFFYANQLRATTAYSPDLVALQAGPTRLVVGVGAASAGQLAHRTGQALAARLGQPAVVFPGDHGGFAAETAAFAEQLRAVLADVG